MRLRWHVGACAAVVCSVAIGATPSAEQVAPELPVAAWRGGSASLEDFKGQVTAVVFFNDGSS